MYSVIKCVFNLFHLPNYRDIPKPCIFLLCIRQFIIKKNHEISSSQIFETFRIHFLKGFWKKSRIQAVLK